MPNYYIYAMVKVASRELIPMKFSFLKSICLAVLFWIIPSAPVLANDGYWKGGYWCSQENNYCRETWRNSYNGGLNNQNYYDNQPRLESIEYNGRIIRTGIRQNSDICSLAIQILGHCDGFIRFDENTRTHIFRNDSHQQYYPNNQWGNRQYRDFRNNVPRWNGGGCVYQDKKIRVFCN